MGGAGAEDGDGGKGSPEAVGEPEVRYGERDDDSLPGEAPLGPVLWFARKPRIGPVMEAAERVARTHT